MCTIYRLHHFLVNDDTSFSFKYKIYIIVGQENHGTKNTEIGVPQKYLSNFCRTLEMPFINCEINLILTWSENCILISDGIENHVPAFAITDTKCYGPVVTLSTQENVKLLNQLKSCFKITINWKKCQSKVSMQA